jgi:hypothetical protein
LKEQKQFKGKWSSTGFGKGSTAIFSLLPGAFVLAAGYVLKSLQQGI